MNPNPLSELTIVLIHSIPLLPSIPFLVPPSTRGRIAAAIAPNGDAELLLSDTPEPELDLTELDFRDAICDLFDLVDAGRAGVGVRVRRDHLSAGWEKSISSLSLDDSLMRPSREGGGDDWL